MISEIEDYFAMGCGRCERFATADCAARKWAEGLALLRGICEAAGLEGTAKWGHPCYMHAGRNIALLNAFRDDFRISFMNPSLLRDPEGVLEPTGPNARHPSLIRFTSVDAVEALRAVIASYLEEAKAYAEEGRTPPRVAAAPELPEELAEALDADPELAEAFRGLTPGRQRSYVINLTGAKKPATRIARIARFRARILAGKGATER